MAMKQVTLRQKVTLNLRPDEVEKYGLSKMPDNPADPIQGKGARVVTLPAGLVNIPEELCEHWYVKGCIEAGKRPLMGGPRIEHSKVPAHTGDDETKKTGDAVVIKPAAELDAMSDDDLREYLRNTGNQQVAAAAPRDKVLARIEKLRPVSEAE